MFDCVENYLSAATPDWGRIALLPWDERIFGFPVADLRLGLHPPPIDSLRAFVNALEEFCSRTKAQLISTRTRGNDMPMIGMLVGAGFSIVEFSLTAKLSRIKLASLSQSRVPLREALPEDTEAICSIAGSAFHFGRYHTDPQFPRELADARYVHWIKTALGGLSKEELVFVLGRPGEVLGFMNVVICNGHADLRLAAVDPQRNFGFEGFSLYAETLRALSERGAKSVSAKFAAANTRALNLYAALGFQFSKPEVVLHWHTLTTSPSFPR